MHAKSNHFICTRLCATLWTSLVAQRVKCLPTMQETRVQSLSQEDPLEKEMETHSSILSWKIPGTEKPGRLQSTGVAKSRTWLSVFTFCHKCGVIAYLRLFIFLLAILIPACASSSPAFPMMYSAYKLNKQGDDIEPLHTPFPIWDQSIVPWPLLTVASWPAYRFLRRQVRRSGIPISFRIFHSLLWSTQSKALA